MKLLAKNNETLTFRRLEKTDGSQLGAFFDGLSADTKSKFGPHPLNLEHANTVLCANIDADNVMRFVISTNNKIVGYFIVDFNHYPDEEARYRGYQIALNFSADPVFAPCIADAYQSLGIASQAVRALIENLRDQNLRSLVLMGGTQAPNLKARHFYKKLGFQELGEFFTEHNGLNNIDMRLML